MKKLILVICLCSQYAIAFEKTGGAMAYDFEIEDESVLIASAERSADSQAEVACRFSEYSYRRAIRVSEFTHTITKQHSYITRINIRATASYECI